MDNMELKARNLIDHMQNRAVMNIRHVNKFYALQWRILQR
jgi:hypothetical protein